MLLAAAALVAHVQGLWLDAGASPAEVVELSAQVHVESHWRPGVCSAWACGLAQFTEPTKGDIWPAVGCAGESVFDVTCQARGQRLYMRRLKAANARAASYADRLDMALASYNGGLGNLRREQKRCRLQPGCDPGRYAGHVQAMCRRRPGACEENTRYPGKVRRAMRVYIRAFER